MKWFKPQETQPPLSDFVDEHHEVLIVTKYKQIKVAQYLKYDEDEKPDWILIDRDATKLDDEDVLFWGYLPNIPEIG